MKIAFILPSLINQGPIIVVQNIVQELQKKGTIEIDIYYFDAKFGANFNCPTYQITMKHAIDFNQYDIIHSNGLRPDKYVHNFKKLIKTAKTISTIHSHIERDLAFTYSQIISWIYAPYWLYLLRSKNTVVTISKVLENIYNKKNFKSIQTIHNGVNITPSVSECDESIKNKIEELKSKNYKILGTYASITKNKGLEQVLNILDQLTDYAFIIIGNGPEEKKLKQKVIDLNLQSRVLFFDYLTKPYNYLPIFDLYIMASYSEGFGLSLVEAAEATKSIVCSDIAVFRELFSEDEVTFFELDNKISLVNAINFAYSERENKGKKANTKAIEKYTSERMAQNYLNLYQKIQD